MMIPIPISCHAWYHVRRGTFTGYVRIPDGSVTHTISAKIARLTRADAFADAAWLADSLRRTNRTTTTHAEDTQP